MLGTAVCLALIAVQTKSLVTLIKQSDWAAVQDAVKRDGRAFLSNWKDEEKTFGILVKTAPVKVFAPILKITYGRLKPIEYATIGDSINLMVCRGRSEEELTLLISQNLVRVQAVGGSACHELAQRGFAKAILALAKKGLAFAGYDDRGYTPAMYSPNSTTLAAVLIDSSCNVPDRSRRPLGHVLVADRLLSVEMLEVLSERGYHFGQKDRFGSTLMDLLAEKAAGDKGYRQLLEACTRYMKRSRDLSLNGCD